MKSSQKKISRSKNRIKINRTKILKTKLVSEQITRTTDHSIDASRTHSFQTSIHGKYAPVSLTQLHIVSSHIFQTDAVPPPVLLHSPTVVMQGKSRVVCC